MTTLYPSDSSERIRDRIITLLTRYASNVERLSRFKDEEEVREWVEAFDPKSWENTLCIADPSQHLGSGGDDGALRASPDRFFEEDVHRSEEGQRGENLLRKEGNDLSYLIHFERRQLFEMLATQRAEVQLVKLLVLTLRDSELQLIRLRYFRGMSITMVCGEMFMSRSTFYRKHDEIVKHLCEAYCEIIKRYQNVESL